MNFIPTTANHFICFSFRYWPNRNWRHTFSKELQVATFLATCVIKNSPSRVVSRDTCSCTQDNTSTTALFAGKDLMKVQISRPTWEFMRVSSITAVIAPNPLSRNVRCRIIYRNILDNIDSRVTSVVKDSTQKLTMINTLNTPSWQADTPLGRPPIRQTHPLGRHPTPPSDGYCSGRYASYWNAFLYIYRTTRISVKAYFCITRLHLHTKHIFSFPECLMIRTLIW